MRKVTVIYSDNDPFNSEPRIVRLQCKNDEKIENVLTDNRVDFYKIHFVIEGHPPVEGEEQESDNRVRYVEDVITHLIHNDPDYCWHWFCSLYDTMVDTEIEPNKAHIAAITFLKRRFNCTPGEPKWFSIEDVPVAHNKGYEVIIEGQDINSNQVSAIVEALYNEYTGWAAVTELKNYTVLLWRYKA